MGVCFLLIYTLILYMHVLSAILSIGPLFVLLPLLKKMRTACLAEMGAYVVTFQTAVTMVKHAGHVLVLSGVLLIWQGSWPWLTSWVVMTVAVMVASIVFLASAFKPTIRTFGTDTYDEIVFVTKLRRATWQYIILLLVMLWLMVAKPVLW